MELANDYAGVQPGTEDQTAKVEGAAWRLPAVLESGTDGLRLIGRPFRMWRLIVSYPNGKLVVVMWNCNDLVSHVKERLQEKTGIPCQDQILQMRGVGSPLVDEHYLFNSNVRDNDVVSMSVCATNSFQIFVKGKNGKTTVLWVTPLDTVNDIKGKIAAKDFAPLKD